jgi:hypothetical protein
MVEDKDEMICHLSNVRYPRSNIRVLLRMFFVRSSNVLVLLSFIPMLWDVPSDTQYNTSSNVRGGKIDRLQWELR